MSFLGLGGVRPERRDGWEALDQCGYQRGPEETQGQEWPFNSMCVLKLGSGEGCH